MDKQTTKKMAILFKSYSLTLRRMFVDAVASFLLVMLFSRCLTPD